MVCDKLPVVENVQFDEKIKLPVQDGQSVNFSCEGIYVPSGFFLCMSDNEWSHGQCRTMSCGDPGYVRNATRIGHLFTYPNKIRYECDDGYKLVGIDSKFCSKTGRWQPPRMPKCVPIECPELMHPKNGKVEYSSRFYESKATYKCDSNYKLIGENTRICDEKGQWTGEEPSCELITCDKPILNLFYGTLLPDLEKYVANSIVRYHCYDGPRTVSKCLNNGTWSSPPPVCPPINIALPPDKPPVNEIPIAENLPKDENSVEKIFPIPEDINPPIQPRVFEIEKKPSKSVNSLLNMYIKYKEKLFWLVLALVVFSLLLIISKKY